MQDKKPDIYWLEGLIDYCFASVDYGKQDPGIRKFCIGVGQFVVGTYAIEILLQYALDNRNISYNARGIISPICIPNFLRRSVTG